MKIKTLIVDDEPLARDRIRVLLNGEPDMEIVGECASADEAFAVIQKRAPDLLFLDIQMPEADGFELLRRIGGESLPVVIFVTAYDNHAVKAFEIHALDYLLKPFKQTRFKEALDRARRCIEDRQTDAASTRLLQMLSERGAATTHLSRLAVKEKDRVLFVKTELVDWIESAGNYILLHAGKETHIVRNTLTALETRLDSGKFLRISRSVLVNLDRVKEVQALCKGEHVIVLQDGKQLSMTRGIRELEKKLQCS